MIKNLTNRNSYETVSIYNDGRNSAIRVCDGNHDIKIFLNQHFCNLYFCDWKEAMVNATIMEKHLPTIDEFKVISKHIDEINEKYRALTNSDYNLILCERSYWTQETRREDTAVVFRSSHDGITTTFGSDRYLKLSVIYLFDK